MAASDKGVLDHINQLVNEEHELFEREASGRATQADRDRLKVLGRELDECWDLLHQRRALRSAGLDPDAAEVRDEGTVEGYVS